MFHNFGNTRGNIKMTSVFQRTSIFYCSTWKMNKIGEPSLCSFFPHIFLTFLLFFLAFSSHFDGFSSHFGVRKLWGKMPIHMLVVWAQLTWASEMLVAETNVYLCKKIRVFTIRKLSNSAFNRRKNHISRTNIKI